MDWDDYRHLLAISRTGTLSGAAGQLGVARTTVGRRVQAVEERLAVRLFDRTPEGFVPTPAGEDLIRVAEAMEAHALAAEARVLGRDVELQGELRVSTLDFVRDGYFDVFRSFIARYPKVELMLGVTTSQVSLRRREAEVVLRLSDTPPGHLVGRRLARLTFRPYAHRDLVDAAGPNPSLADYPWLADDPRDPTAFMETWLASVAPAARILLRTNTYSSVHTIVRRGLAAHLLPDVTAQDDPTLVSIAPEMEPFARDLWVLTLPDLRSNIRVRAFLDHVYDWFDK